jgi:surface antigen
MAREIYDTSTLLEVMEEQDSPANYWLSLLFQNELTFDDEWVDFEKIPRAGRKLAPFVAPLAQGRPIYEEGSSVGRFKPAYVKPKDPVTPSRVIARRPGEILSRAPQSPEDRRNAIIADITAFHRAAIERRWEWLAAQAVLYGAVTIVGDDYPARVVDFGRAAGHSITLGVNARWGDSGVSIFDNIQTWMELMQLAPFGGVPTRITMGVSAWAKLRKDAEVKDFLDTTYRGNEDVSIQRGLTKPGEVRYVGSLGIGLDVYVYSDYYTVNGTSTPFMDPRDVLLSSPAVDGYQCFGAILDPHADFRPLPIYPRNWINDDPPVEYVMSQSAPLMVPVNPNATLRARVVA